MKFPQNRYLPIIRDLLWSSMHADYSQSWKVFYTDTRHQAAKITLVWSGENIRKPALKGEKHISKWIYSRKSAVEV